MVGGEFLTGVLVGLLAGWSIGRKMLMGKFVLMYEMGLVKLVDSSQVDALAEKYFKERLGKLREKYGKKPPEEKKEE